MNRTQGPNTYRTPLRGARERFVSARDREGERAPPATPAVNSCFTTSAGRSAPPRHSPGNHSKKDAKSFLARMATDIRHHRGISGFPRPRPLPLSGEKFTSIPFPRMRRRDASSAHKPSGENQDVDAPRPLPPVRNLGQGRGGPDRRPAGDRRGRTKQAYSVYPLHCLRWRRSAGKVGSAIRSGRRLPLSLPPSLSLSLSLSAGEVRTAHQ